MALSSEKRVLVVEDEPDVRLFLQTVLEDAGFRVMTAEDGEKAWEIINREKPDFISLDLILPRRSGRRLLRDLQADDTLKKIPVLLVTAHAKDGLGSEGPEDVLNHFILEGPGRLLEKPVKPEDLVRCVSETLGVEVAPEATEKIGMRREAERLVAKADPEALQRALKALQG